MPNYNKYFKRILKETAEMSTCARVQVGCVIVRDGRIISTGWNGVPAKKKHCNNHFKKKEWKGIESYLSEKHNKWSTQNEIHAETNAIGYAAQNGVSIKEAVLYTSISPCVFCAKLICASGIKKVFYVKEYDRDNGGIKFLKENNVNCEELKYD